LKYFQAVEDTSVIINIEFNRKQNFIKSDQTSNFSTHFLSAIKPVYKKNVDMQCILENWKMTIFFR